jgi:hypothetical protein
MAVATQTYYELMEVVNIFGTVKVPKAVAYGESAFYANMPNTQKLTGIPVATPKLGDLRFAIGKANRGNTQPRYLAATNFVRSCTSQTRLQDCE